MSERTASEADRRELGWTLSQRRGLLVLLTILLAFLAFQFVRNRLYISDPQPKAGARAGELESRIDPNSADWQTLAAIPGLGEKRARAIVAFRDSVHKTGAQKLAFQRPGDLIHIRGIGPATVENLRPYLVFPSDYRQTQY
jgi:hypothetical protein